jgi:uncharacterized membrane protein
MTCPTVLAQAAFVPVLWWVAALIGLVLAGAIVVMFLRRRLLAPTPPTEAGMMESIRAMRARGEISQEEFEAVRASLAARLAHRAPRTATGDGPAEPAPRPTDR